MYVIGDDAGGRPVVMNPQQVAELSQDIEITIDDVENLAKTVLEHLRQTVAEQRDEIFAIPLKAHNFGGSPAGAELATAHEAAHEVFLRTVEAVLGDLHRFQDTILEAVKKYRDSDATGEELLLRASRMSEHLTYQAEAVKSEAVLEQERYLGDRPDEPAAFSTEEVSVPAPSPVSSDQAMPSSTRPGMDAPLS